MIKLLIRWFKNRRSQKRLDRFNRLWDEWNDSKYGG